MNYTVEINFKGGEIVKMTRKCADYKDAKKCMDKYFNAMATEDNDELGIIKISLHIEAA